MHLFKEPVALEACPAKTAESVSYGATFAVLAWLLATNYLGVGFAGDPGNERMLAQFESTLSSESPLGETPGTGSSDSAQPLQSFPDVQFSEPNDVDRPDFVVWQASFDLQPEIGSRLASQSTPVLSGRPETQSPQVLSPLEELRLPLPLIEPDTFLFDAAEGTELASTKVEGLADDSSAIGEITVFAEDAERLRARPDNINRPQIPRPLRAQQVQRSLLLPPRIQALRP